MIKKYGETRRKRCPICREMFDYIISSTNPPKVCRKFKCQQIHLFGLEDCLKRGIA